MPAKVTKKAASKRMICDAFFHWEFLRRSEIYSQDYGKFVKKYESWFKNAFDPACVYGESIRRKEDLYDRKSYAARAIRDLRNFRTKWGIDPTPPDLAATQEQVQAVPQLNPFLCEKKLHVFNYGPATAHLINDPEVLTICIDLTGPLVDLLSQIEFILKYRKQTNSEQTEVKKKRKRPDAFEKYLLVYDLRKKGKSYIDIAIALKLADPKIAREYKRKANLWIKRVTKKKW